MTLPAEDAASAHGHGRLTGPRVLRPAGLDRAAHEAWRPTLTLAPPLAIAATANA